MTHDFVGWTLPPGAVVEPPVHPETVVSVIYSDGIIDGDRPARCHNWSSVGDGPCVVAYAVVEEYKPAPREWWIVDGCEAWDDKQEALWNVGGRSVIHVREVPDPSREVVAWAVLNENGQCICLSGFEATSKGIARDNGGTVVKLTGVMP